MNAISIHAPRMGSDAIDAQIIKTRAISIHAPRMGSDDAEKYDILKARNFNPRSPHGERPLSLTRPFMPLYFNPRSPHGERQYRHADSSRWFLISIHAPRMGSDHTRSLLRPRKCNFNPRSPHGERLAFLHPANAVIKDFNPRSPHGERQHNS